MITVRDKVRFVETDMMGVTHHANYLRWFEMARVAYLRACGLTLGELMDDGIIFPITEVSAKYKNSTTFDDEWEVQVVMSAFNRAKMAFDYRVIRVCDGALAVEGHTCNVFTDKKGNIVRLPAKFYDKIKAVVDSDHGFEE